jgi:hypothetical protein
MAVELDSARKSVVITWGDHVKGEYVEIRTTNPDVPDDPSWRRASNDQHSSSLSFPADYHGEVHVVVTGDEGTTDEGDIEV